MQRNNVSVKGVANDKACLPSKAQKLHAAGIAVHKREGELLY
jgi:hypothetical protein